MHSTLISIKKKKKGNQRTDNFAIVEVMFPNAFFKYFYFKMLFIFKTRCYFIIIHTNKLEITLRSYLFNAFLICLALLYGTKPKTIFQKSLELTLKLS